MAAGSPAASMQARQVVLLHAHVVGAPDRSVAGHDRGRQVDERSSDSIHAAGSPSKASGVTPKLHIAPANSTSDSGTSTTRFIADCPSIGMAYVAGVQLGGLGDDVGHRPGRHLVVELGGQVREERPVHRGVGWLVEVGAGRDRAVAPRPS